MTISFLLGQEERDPKFAAFLRAVHNAVEQEPRVLALTDRVHDAMGELLATWTMPDARYTAMQPGYPYGSFLLYKNGDDGFVVIIDTFEGNQTTRIHNHRTWAVVGLIEGRESEMRYRAPHGLQAPPEKISETVTQPGDIVKILEPDFHSLTTTPGHNSISFHVYGADVGVIRRLCWDTEKACYREFTQGYSNTVMNLPPYFEAAGGIGAAAARAGVSV